MEAKAKAKAIELFNKFNIEILTNADRFPVWAKKRAKQCAIIAVDEIMKINTIFRTKEDAIMTGYYESDSCDYWQEVKTEINKL